MKITGRLVSLYIMPNACHHLSLDGILAYALSVKNRLQSHKIKSLSLPLETPWHRVYGDNIACLWNCSSFYPKGTSVTSDVYYTKRYPPMLATLTTKPNVNRKKGRHKSTYAHLPACHAESMEATALGNIEEVKRLLDSVPNVGAKAAWGYGRIAQWTVEETDPQDHLHRRPVPVEAMSDLDLDAKGMILSPSCGWTPPYWNVEWHLPCYYPQPPVSPQLSQL